MKRLLKIITSLSLMVSMLSATAFAATSYQKEYGYGFGISNVSARSTMGEKYSNLVGTTIEGSVVGANDYVILNTVDTTQLNNYKNYGNGFTNVFVWLENAEGTGVTKLHGGTGAFLGFKGYADNGSSGEFALGGTGVPQMYATTGAGSGVSEGSGGAYRITPVSNYHITYGREDLDMSGISTFTYKFNFYKDNGSGVPQIHAYLTQGENQHKKSAENKFKLFQTDGMGKIYHFSDAIASNKSVYVNVDWWNSAADRFNILTITVDNTGETPTVKYKFTKNDGTFIYESPSTEITGNFNFNSDMGLKFVVCDEWSQGNSVELGYYDMNSKILKTNTYSESFKVKNNNTSSNISGSAVISALYDANNQLIDCKIRPNQLIEKGQTKIFSSELKLKSGMDSADDFTVKHFVWNSMGEMKPLGTLDTSSFAPTVNCD